MKSVHTQNARKSINAHARAMAIDILYVIDRDFFNFWAFMH